MLTVAFGDLHHDGQRLLCTRLAADCCGKECANAECDIDILVELPGNLECLVRIQAVAPAGSLGLRVDLATLVVVDKHVAPLERVAAVVAAAVVELHEGDIEVAEERSETEVVAQGDTEGTAELVVPVGEDPLLGVLQENALCLCDCVKLVGKCSNRFTVALDCEPDIGCSHERRAELEEVHDHVLVPLVVDATADTEVGNREAASFAPSLVPLDNDFLEVLLGVFPVELLAIEVELLNNLQHIDFEPEHIELRTVSNDADAAVHGRVGKYADVLAVKLELLEVTDEVLAEPRELLADALDFFLGVAQGTEPVEFGTDVLNEISEVYALRTEAEFPLSRIVVATVLVELTH